MIQDAQIPGRTVNWRIKRRQPLLENLWKSGAYSCLQCWKYACRNDLLCEYSSKRCFNLRLHLYVVHEMKFNFVKLMLIYLGILIFLKIV